MFLGNGLHSRKIIWYSSSLIGFITVSFQQFNWDFYFVNMFKFPHFTQISEGYQVNLLWGIQFAVKAWFSWVSFCYPSLMVFVFWLLVTMLYFSVRSASPSLAEVGSDFKRLHLMSLIESLPWTCSSFSLLGVCSDLGTALALHLSHSQCLVLCGHIAPCSVQMGGGWINRWLIVRLQFPLNFNMVPPASARGNFELWASLKLLLSSSSSCMSFGFLFPSLLLLCDSDITPFLVLRNSSEIVFHQGLSLFSTVLMTLFS